MDEYTVVLKSSKTVDSSAFRACLVLYSRRSSLTASRISALVWAVHIWKSSGRRPIHRSRLHFQKDNSDSLVTCSVHGTNLLPKNYYSGSCGNLRNRTVEGKDFKSSCIVDCCTCLPPITQYNLSPDVPILLVFPSCQRSFPPSERNIGRIYCLCDVAEGAGLEPTHPFRLLLV